MSEGGENLIYRDNVRRLSDAMRDVRIAKADRNDVVVDLKEADRARLEILAEELKPVIDDIPANDDQFDFAISNGLQPRLWVDAASHVMMGRDRRTYRFVRDTRLGRVVLAETADIRRIRENVTDYIAERIVERQRMMEGELEPLRPQQVIMSDGSAEVSGIHMAQLGRAADIDEKWREIAVNATWFAIGAVTGAGLLMLWLWDRIPQLSGG